METSPKSNYETRVTQFTVLPMNEPIFSERATVITIEDEAAGEFISLAQSHGDASKVLIEANEWPLIRQSVDTMMALITEREARKQT